VKLAIGLILCSAVLAAFLLKRTAEPTARITSKVLVSGVTPFGVNIGVWQPWGAEQLMSNIVKNPGFEGMVDRAIAVPAHIGIDSFDDSPAGLARPEEFWDGGRYDIRTGPSAGSTGKIDHSLEHNLFGLPSFIIKAGAEMPLPGDAVAVTKLSNAELPAQWWFNGPANSFGVDTTEVRPGSPGERSLRIKSLAGQQPDVISYFDAIGERAGKLMPLQGRWELSVWSRLKSGTANLHVQFGRDGAAPLLSREVPLTSVWVNQHFSFEGSDDGPPHTASLHFQFNTPTEATILLDDVSLRRVSDGDAPFRHEVLSALRSLHPGYLRDWQGQLGDTLQNRTAPEFARKSFRYRPGNLEQSDFGYGLDEFLDLCLRTGANPWIIVPTTFSDEECSGLGTHLQNFRHRAAFREVLTEFGNENWNDIFRAGAISEPLAHAQAADRCFAEIRSHAPAVALKTVLNAQHVNPVSAINLAKHSGQSDLIAVAPYFLPSMSEGMSPNTALREMYAGDGGAIRKLAQALPELKKEAAVYEVNVHTISGTASGTERTPVIAGRPAAGALAKTMLDALELGARRQCVYTLAGFDFQLPNQQGFARLWGVARDLSDNFRLRPTGLALKLLNESIAGQMVMVETSKLSDVSVYGFHSDTGWVVIAISSRDAPLRFDLQFETPLSDGLPIRASAITSKFWYSTNEDSEDVSVATTTLAASKGKLSYEIQPWTLAVLRFGSQR
jgi:hypothetical protein